MSTESHVLWRGYPPDSLKGLSMFDFNEPYTTVCVSDHVSEWLSQIVLDKVHLRWEIEQSQPPGEIRATENGAPMLEG